MRVVREKYTITPADMLPLRKQFPTAYYACIFLFHPKIAAGHDCLQPLAELQDEAVWIGHGRLHRSGWSIKILAAESVSFRRALHVARQLCHEAIGSAVPHLRKF